ncbi:hypothetical protein EXIGLDRAFT_698488 [Exidia glandulosa HHB12029]|uniref:Uncharacterized protein n=1 Tax=Exidia glandulosa HHB12029 TaxID=1314781 RepID=A0A165E960_EXIGL|nr:hypothetical protein EXIGLDRAFT_698488 [Exidia glandulosa HHB12029]
MSTTGFTLTIENGAAVKCRLEGTHDWEVTVEQLNDGSTTLKAVAQSKPQFEYRSFEEDLAAGYSQPEIGTEEFARQFGENKKDLTTDDFGFAPASNNIDALQVELRDLRDRMDKTYRALETAHFKMRNFIRREFYRRDSSIGHSQTQDWASDNENAGNTVSPLGSPVKEPPPKRRREDIDE